MKLRKQPMGRFNRMNFRRGCMCYICARKVENRERIPVTCLHVSEHMSDPHDCLSSQQRIFKLNVHENVLSNIP